MEKSDILARNKAVVRKFLNTIPDQNWRAISDSLAEDLTLYFQRPTVLSDAGGTSTPFLRGRDRLINDLGIHIGQIFRAGTIRVGIESMIAEGDMVGARFILTATTVRRNEFYENFYYYHFRLRDGQITECWEYLDNLYAAKMLFGQGNAGAPGG
jgi:ketosteroid isomerase-like protein